MLHIFPNIIPIIPLTPFVDFFMRGKTYFNIFDTIFVYDRNYDDD